MYGEFVYMPGERGYDVKDEDGVKMVVEGCSPCRGCVCIHQHPYIYHHYKQHQHPVISSVERRLLLGEKVGIWQCYLLLAHKVNSQIIKGFASFLAPKRQTDRQTDTRPIRLTFALLHLPLFLCDLWPLCDIFVFFLATSHLCVAGVVFALSLQPEVYPPTCPIHRPVTFLARRLNLAG